jgi:hypothetical protein
VVSVLYAAFGGAAGKRHLPGEELLQGIGLLKVLKQKLAFKIFAGNKKRASLARFSISRQKPMAFRRPTGSTRA